MDYDIWEIIQGALSIVGAAAVAAAAAFPKIRHSAPLIFKILDVLGANFGGAKNKEE